MKIYIDGACSGNGTESAEAGWGYVTEYNGKTLVRKGKVPGKQTNNRAELMALLKSLQFVRQLRQEDGLSTATILSDSKLMVDGITGKAKRKANRDIWQDIENLFIELRGTVAIEIRHIPREQNKADGAAKQASQSLI